MQRIIGLTAACGALVALAVSTGSLSASAAGNDDWAMFHYNGAHAGVSPDTAINATHAPSLNLVWSASVGGGPVYASPAVVYSTALSEVLVYEVSVGGEVHAFNAANGTSVWTANVGAPVFDSPAIYDNTLYIGNDTGLLSALNASTGALECSYQLPVFAPETEPGRIESSPTVGEDSSGPVVYFGDTGQEESDNAGHEWALNGFGNSAGACSVLWSYNLAKTAKSKHSGSWSPPALATDGTGRPLVVFGSTQPDDAIYALNADTGALVWRFQTLKTFSDADVGAAPSISAPGANGITDGAVYEVGKDGMEYALDLLTGAQLWSFNLYADTGKRVNAESSAALIVASVGDGDVITAYARYVYEFDAVTGKELWRSVATTKNVLGSPAVSGPSGNQVVMIGDLEGREYAFQLSNGALLDKLTLGSKNTFWASTAISDSMVFNGGTDGNLYAVG
jgi:outer membrane protein assembly factor BamB